MSRIKPANWLLLEPVQTADLIETRLQLHYAAQFAAAFGRYLLPARKDDSHTSLSWDTGNAVLWTRWLSAGTRCRVGLAPRDFALIFEQRGGEASRYQLAGRSRAAVEEWLRYSLGVANIPLEAFSLEMPYDLPAHPLADGAPFTALQPQAAEMLTRCWHNAAVLLEQKFYHEHEASTLRCWPHHFDIATLVKIEGHKDPEKAKTIGVGLSPGDASYPEPYFYLTPWPYPASMPAMAPLSAGHWHTEGWVGAVLPGADIAALAPERQWEVCWHFLEEAWQAAYGLVLA